MNFMVPFLFLFGCWAQPAVKTEVVSRRVVIHQPVACRICAEGEELGFCLPKMPEYEWGMDDDARAEMKYQLLKWMEYAAHCLGVVYQDPHSLIFD